MTTSSKALLAAACMAAFVLGAPQRALALPSYKVTAVLPTLPSSASSYTTLYLSDSGDIAGGTSGIVGTAHTAFVWRPSTGLTNLSSPFGLSSYVQGINADGTVVGAVNVNSTTTAAWAWSADGTSQNIATLAGTACHVQRSHGHQQPRRRHGVLQRARGPGPSVHMVAHPGQDRP